MFNLIVPKITFILTDVVIMIRDESNKGECKGYWPLIYFNHDFQINAFEI